MPMLLAAVLLLGFSAFTAARAEWEILSSSSAVYAGAPAAVPSTITVAGAAAK